MALRKFLYMSAEGFSAEQNAADELALGKVTLSGVAGVSLDAGGGRVTGLDLPSADDDAASKAYVDSVVEGLDIKQSVVAMSDGNTTLSGLQTIDDISLTAGKRVLLTGQTDARENGIWLVAAGAWTRPSDFEVGDEAAGAFTFVESGTVYGGTGWVCTAPGGNDIIGTDNLPFSQFSGSGVITAGAGLVKSGSELSVGKGAGISVLSDKVAVDIAADSALEFSSLDDAGKLRWKPDTNRGLAMDSSGAYVALATTPGLRFDSGLLEVFLNAAGGLEKTASGVGLKINDTPDTLDVDASGLKVTGLPALFKINGVAVSAAVTTANLNELVGGGQTSLHSHAPTPTDRVEEETTANTSISLGDPVSMSSVNNRVVKGDAASDAAARVIGVAVNTATAGNPVSVVKRGTATGVLIGATPNTPYYLAAGGGLTTSLPAVGNRVIMVGYAKNATDLEVVIHDYGKR